MRLLTLPAVSVLSLVASSVLADEFTLDSTVTAATVFPQGAKVTRIVTFDVDAGTHQLTIADLPEDLAFELIARLGRWSHARIDLLPAIRRFLHT